MCIADTHSKIFVENMKSENQEEQRISFNLFNSILKCTNLPGHYPVDETSSILAFGFWFTLQVMKYICTHLVNTILGSTYSLFNEVTLKFFLSERLPYYFIDISVYRIAICRFFFFFN